jgi:hypothetical protein
VFKLAAEVDRQILERIGLIGHPVGMRVRQQRRIEASAAAGAHFQREVGQCGAQFILKLVQPFVVRN